MLSVALALCLHASPELFVTVETGGVRKVPAWVAPPEDQARFYATRDLRAPQPKNPKEWFTQAPKSFQPGGLRNGVLACRAEASTEKRWDTFADPDLLVTLRIPDVPGIAVYGAETSYVAYVTYPNVKLKVGDKVGIVVEDRDVTSNELVGADTLRYEGSFPLLFDSEFLKAECRLVDPGLVQQQRDKGLKALGVLAQFHGTGSPSLELKDLGAQRLQAPLDTFNRSLLELLPWLGWADTKLWTAVDQVDATLTRWRAELKPQIDAKLAASKDNKTQLKGLRVEADPNGVTFWNETQKPVSLEGLDADFMWFYADGAFADARFELAANKPLAPGENLRRGLNAICLSRLCGTPGTPVMLRIGHGAKAVFLRL